MKKEILTNLMVTIQMLNGIMTDLLLEFEKEKTPEVEPTCKHPSTERLNLTVMGGKERWVCKRCGFSYDESLELLDPEFIEALEGDPQKD